MARADELLLEAIRGLGAKPPEESSQAIKKRYSERLSELAAYALADELRRRGMSGTLPERPGPGRASGAERRMAGGIGAKKVDVTWATEESGLLFAISVKSINWRDVRTRNYQKNLVNRRGDMLIEAVTLHRRFPYAVLAGSSSWTKARRTTPPSAAGLLSTTPTTVSSFSPAGRIPPDGTSSTSGCTSSCWRATLQVRASRSTKWAGPTSRWSSPRFSTTCCASLPTAIRISTSSRTGIS